MKCRNCKHSLYNADRGIYFCDNVRSDLFGTYPHIELDEDCMFDDRRMIKCRDCKYCESNYVPYCTKHKMHVHTEYDGCTFGIKKITNREKFEKIFGISFADFLSVNVLEWADQDYEGQLCED